MAAPLPLHLRLLGAHPALEVPACALRPGTRSHFCVRVGARGPAVRGRPGPEGPRCPDPGVSSLGLVRMWPHNPHSHDKSDLHTLDWAWDRPVPRFGAGPAP